MNLDSQHWAVIEQLQEGIPIERRPFDYPALCVGMTPTEFIARMLQLKHDGVIRRMGVRLRHHKAGVQGNALVVWQVPERDVERVGTLFASMPEVSHCYTRATCDGFPYNLYTMVHAPAREEVDNVVRRMVEKSGVNEYIMLRTLRELKKSTPRYRRPESDGR